MKKKNIFTIAIATILVVVMAVAFTACGPKDKDKDPTTTTPTSETETVFVPVIEDVTDEAGEPVTDAEGEKVTEVVGTTAVVVDKDEKTPSFVQKPKPTKPVTDKETEEATTKAPSTTKAPTPTKAPETTKPAPKPTEKPTQPKPTEPKPTEPPTTKPSGGGLDTWNEKPLDPGGYVQDPNTDAEDIDKDAEENGWNTDWELN